MSETVIPKKTYVFVWASLLALLGATVAIAYVHLGRFNAAAAFTIASIKAVIIILYFMHVRYSTRLTALTAVGGLFFLGILIAMTLNDYASRGLVLPVPGK